MLLPHQCVCAKNVKVNFCHAHIMKALMGGWGITLLIPNLSTRWTSVVNFVPQLLHPRKELQYPLNRRLSGFQSKPGHFRAGKSLMPVWGFETPTVQPIASYTGYTIPASHTCVLGIVFINDIVIGVHGTWFVPKVSVLIFYLNVYWTHLKLQVISFKV